MPQSLPQSSERFLLVRLSSLGDLVHTLPVISALRSTFPRARLDWLVDRRWFPLMQLVTGIDEVIPLDRSVSGYVRCARRLRQARYSCAIDFQGLYRSALLVWLSHAERRVGRDRSAAREPGAAWFYTEPVIPTGQHVAEMNMSLAVGAGAQQPPEMDFPLSIPDAESGRLRKTLVEEGIDAYVVVTPGGGWRSKCWPPERYAALCSELWRKHGLRAVINVGPREENLSAEIVRASSPAVLLVVSPQLAELVRTACRSEAGHRWRYRTAASRRSSREARRGALRAYRPRAQQTIASRDRSPQRYLRSHHLPTRRLRSRRRLFSGHAFAQRQPGAYRCRTGVRDTAAHGTVVLPAKAVTHVFVLQQRKVHSRPK